MQYTKLSTEVTTIPVDALPLVHANDKISSLAVGEVVLMQDMDGHFCSRYLVRRRSKNAYETVALWEFETPEGLVYTNGFGEGEGLVYSRTTINPVVLKSYRVAVKVETAEYIVDAKKEDDYPSEFVKWLRVRKPTLSGYTKEQNDEYDAIYETLQRTITPESCTFGELWSMAYALMGGDLSYSLNDSDISQVLKDALVTVCHRFE